MAILRVFGCIAFLLSSALSLATSSDICIEFKNGNCVRHNTEIAIDGKSCLEECQHWDNANNCKLRSSCTYDSASHCFVKKHCEKYDKVFNCQHWTRSMICGGGKTCKEKCLKYDAFSECKLAETCTFDLASKCIERKTCALMDAHKTDCKHWNTQHICP